MIIQCLHGYFIVREQITGEIARFNSLFGMDLVANGDHYTFAALVDAPRYSILGKPYLGLLATATIEADNPWEVMEANGYVYNFETGFVIPISTVTRQISPFRRYDSYFLSGLIMPGSINAKTFGRVTGYTCQIDVNDSLLKFNYSELYG